MFHSGKRATPGSAVTVSHVSDAFAIDLGARLQQIHAAANIGNQLNVALLLPFGMIEIVSQAAGPIEDGIDQQRLGSGARKNKRFGKDSVRLPCPQRTKMTAGNGPLPGGTTRNAGTLPPFGLA